jgi:5'-3' exoribonuclease 1
MGIPSYFSHIIRNYSNIIRGLQFFRQNNHVLHHLFMDCNSIVYDAVRELVDQYTPDTTVDFEQNIIKEVIKRIQMYINLISPCKSIFIAFDGVAPFAKMGQQRTRRYKSAMNMQTEDVNEPTDNVAWNTSAITPGTTFMRKLSTEIYYEFNHNEHKYNVENIHVSCSDQPGEGEHKIFDHLRKNLNSTENVALYGLDSDLIMLAIFNLNFCKNIYVFREAPEFIKSSIQVVSESKNDPLFLDILTFSHSILNEMNCVDRSKQRIYDYVFLCFLLGNDFLPHFPALNIRTHGIQVLLDVYRKYVGNRENNFIIAEHKEIQWKNVNRIISEIAKREHELLTVEYSTRAKFERRKFAESTRDDQNEMITNLPIIYRGVEHYICPSVVKWEERYYKSLFHTDRSNNFIKQLCTNYMEGLEWVYRYYSSECIDWRWKYDYHYAPLFTDLYKYVPHFEQSFFSETNKKNIPYSSDTQLAYVLPNPTLHLAPEKICAFIRQYYQELYPDTYTLQWAFCRYLWEAHPNIPEIPRHLLDQWDIQFRMHEKTIHVK